MASISVSHEYSTWKPACDSVNVHSKPSTPIHYIFCYQVIIFCIPGHALFNFCCHRKHNRHFIICAPSDNVCFVTLQCRHIDWFHVAPYTMPDYKAHRCPFALAADGNLTLSIEEGLREAARFCRSIESHFPIGCLCHRDNREESHDTPILLPPLYPGSLPSPLLK